MLSSPINKQSRAVRHEGRDVYSSKQDLANLNLLLKPLLGCGRGSLGKCTISGLDGEKDPWRDPLM